MELVNLKGGWEWASNPQRLTPRPVPVCTVLTPRKGSMAPALNEIRESEALPIHPLLLIPIDETSFEAGIKVQIHSQDEPPFIDQLGFGVAPGFQTFVSCQEQRVRGPREGGPRGYVLRGQDGVVGNQYRRNR